MSTVLGFDISTAVVGVSLFSDNNFITSRAIVTPKKATIWEKVDHVGKELRNILNDFLILGHTPTHVYIEQDLQAFRPGFSSAKTLMTLAKMNGMVSYLIRQETGIDPEYFDVKVARKLVGLKLVKKSKLNRNPPTTKEQVVSFVESVQPDFPWEYKTLKSGPRKGQTVLANHANDMADAYVIGLAGTVALSA